MLSFAITIYYILGKNAKQKVKLDSKKCYAKLFQSIIKIKVLYD